jgi:hypothetical protein
VEANLGRRAALLYGGCGGAAKGGLHAHAHAHLSLGVFGSECQILEGQPEGGLHIHQSLLVGASTTFKISLMSCFQSPTSMQRIQCHRSLPTSTDDEEKCCSVNSTRRHIRTENVVALSAILHWLVSSSGGLFRLGDCWLL